MRTRFLPAVLILFCSLEATAEIRTWKDRTGRHETRAELMEVGDGQVHLRKTDGSLITVPIEQLSEEDRQYLASAGRGQKPHAGQETAANPSGNAEPKVQVCQLATKYFGQFRVVQLSDSGVRLDSIESLPQPRLVTAMMHPGQPDRDADAFRRLVQKEPEYSCREPFRAVLRLGTQEYAFALDRTQERPVGGEWYDRLFFDLNHNGDLTDEPPVDGKGGGKTSSFPRIDLAIPIDGSSSDYAFYLSAVTNPLRRSDGTGTGVGVTLCPAVCRQGTVSLDGRAQTVTIVDFNSNGRFDDEAHFTGAGGGLLESRRDTFDTGDLLVLGREDEGKTPSANLRTRLADPRRVPVSRVARLGGRYYDLTITPAGDRMTVVPTAKPLGKVAVPHPGFVGTFRGEYGVAKVSGDPGAELMPCGRWTLLEYTIDLGTLRGSARRPSLKQRPSSPEAPSVTPSDSLLSASGGEGVLAVEVREGSVVPLPFGPPYRPIVRPVRGDRRFGTPLVLSLVGKGGELCTNLQIDGRRPENPSLTIRDPEGKIVHEGQFRLGPGGFSPLHFWQVPSALAKEYRVAVRMQAGSVEIDTQYESLLQDSQLR